MISSSSLNRKTRKCNGGQNIKVFVRSRPINQFEKNLKSCSLVECQNKEVIVRERPQDKFIKTFNFDKVFGHDSKQVDVYRAVAKPLVEEVLAGFNCTIFAYGQTGTGKTYTMEGERVSDSTSWEEAPLSGIIPRCVNHLFDELRRQKLEFSMRVSFLELYNEELFDLLSPNDDLSKLRLYEDSTRKGSCIIQGLEEVLVRSKGDVYNIIEKGSAKRQTAGTLLNAHSSRSHTVFTVTVHIKETILDGDELLKIGKLHLVDLAGSENIGRSGAVEKRAREAGNINNSLLTLGRVITSLVEKAPHIPYRESKLTRLLQDALGGRTKTSIIATISPAAVNLDETLSTLDYAHRAKNILNKPEVNQKLNKKELIGEYSNEIERLRRDLMAAREKTGVYLANENYDEMISTLDLQSQEISEKIALINVLQDELERKTELFAETSQKLEEVESALMDTKVTLNYTQKLLHQTANERDEQKFIVSVQQRTEEVLHTQGHNLINIANQTTSDIQKLHDKLYRKSTTENYNEDAFANFQQIFKNQVCVVKEHHTGFASKHMERIQDIAARINANVSKCKEELSAVSSSIVLASQRIDDFMASLVELNKLQAEKQISRWNVFSDEVITDCENDILNVKSFNKDSFLPAIAQLANLIDTQGHALEGLGSYLNGKLNILGLENESYFKEIESNNKEYESKLSVHCNLNLQKMDSLLNMTQSVKSSSSAHQKNVLEKIELIEKQLSGLKSSVSTEGEAMNNYAKSMDICIEESKVEDSAALESIKEYFSKATDLHKHKMHALKSYEEDIHEIAEKKTQEMDSVLRLIGEERCSIESSVGSRLESCVRGLSALQGMMQISRDEFTKHVDFNKKEIKEQVEICGDFISTLLQNGSVIDKERARQELEGQLLEDECNSIFTSLMERVDEQMVEMDSCQALATELITEKLMKDIPTGETPVRKEYHFCSNLAATSPYERILQRFRSTASGASSVPLPLSYDTDSASEKSLFVVPPAPLKKHESVEHINVGTQSRSSSTSSLVESKENIIKYEKCKKEFKNLASDEGATEKISRTLKVLGSHN